MANSRIDLVTTKIDGTFPVEGKDNKSEGFRSNFTNINTNLERAKLDIEDLLSNSVLKAPLPSAQINAVDNDLNGNEIHNLAIRDVVFDTKLHNTASGNPLPSDSVIDYFAPIAAWAAILQDGVVGQTKMITNVGSANVNVTVNNAHWGTNVVLPPNTGVTLVFVGTAWACVGNNGATLS